jgi:sec-independent protein translocase protein TatB
MFGFDSLEFLVVAIVALVVIGPKDLPNVMRTVGHWVGRARGMARHFRSGIDTMMREAELEEMEKKWREENERIMRDHPLLPGTDDAPDYDHPSMAPPPYPDPEFPQSEADAPRLPLGDESASPEGEKPS